ncbi:hypothetical protein VTH06DRAFT_6572 [Thermothelomyces fergusii]
MHRGAGILVFRLAVLETIKVVWIGSTAPGVPPSEVSRSKLSEDVHKVIWREGRVRRGWRLGSPWHQVPSSSCPSKSRIYAPLPCAIE